MGSLFLLTTFSFSLNGREIVIVNSHGRVEQRKNLLPSFLTPQKLEDSWLGKDKFLHLTVSSFLTGVSYRVYHDEFKNPEENSRLFGGTFTAFLGIGKEAVDATSPSSTSSWKDLAADGVGILLGLLLFTTTF